MKKLLIICIMLCIILNLEATLSFADRYVSCAETLEYMGVFKGVQYESGTNYELSRGAKRSEALVMLIRLLGEEQAAQACTYSHNFEDVPYGNWAYPYVAYAAEKNYTSGVSETSFSPDAQVNLKSYITFLLRALGYSDANGDFSYNNAVEKAVETGLIIKGTFANGDDICLRDDCAYLSMRALNTLMNQKNITLGEELMSKGIIPKDSGDKIKQTLESADKQITNAYISSTTLLPESAFSYCEYDNGKVINAMIHRGYYNPIANRYLGYSYDENGNMSKKVQLSYSWQPFSMKFQRDDNGRVLYATRSSINPFDDIHFEDEIPDFTENFYYTYNNETGNLDSIHISDGQTNAYINFEYDGSTATAKISNRNNILEDFDELELRLPGITKLVILGQVSVNEAATIYFNSDGMVTSTYNRYDKLIYTCTYDSEGKITEETNINYKYTNDYSDVIQVGTQVARYSYNPNGTLSQVVYEYVDRTEVFTFRYFGNGKLDRILCSFYGENYHGETWNQANVEYDENGHFSAPYFI